MTEALAAAMLGATGCVSAPSGGSVAVPRVDEGGPVRVALATAASDVQLAATGRWRLYDRGGAAAAVGGEGERWRIERRERRMRVVRADGTPGPWREDPLTLRTVDAGAMVLWNQRRYRGELVISVGDSGLAVVNRLPLEGYLRGVVPLEIGRRVPAERAAVEAQAVAARSYVASRIGDNVTKPYDISATVLNQVYGGADAETPLTDAAVSATRGMVLTYGGRVIGAPYHSTCGGSTAEPPEVWRATAQPYLTRVSDRVAGTDRFYCDAAPRFRWERSYEGEALTATIERYLRAYAATPTGSLGAVRALATDGTTPSGRVAAILVTTDRGSFRVRGNDIRSVLRSSGGELLNSTYFSLEPVFGGGGRLTQLTVRGRGYGHGVGMCQWGAIGRARAGQDARSILATYYPGTTLGHLD